MAADTSSDDGTYRLRRPATAEEWDAYHAIRRSVAFEDDAETDVDEQAPGHYPLLLWCGRRPVGTIRIDALDGGAAAFRLVAVDPREQGRGHGRILLREAEAFARDIGCRKAVVYATPEAAGFYDSAGYAEDPFDDQYFGGIVQMTKPLHYVGFSTDDDP